MWENGLLTKIKLNSRIWEFKTSQSEKQILKIHILPNILRSKENLTMKFGQLIEYVMNIFLETSYTKCGGEGKSQANLCKIKIELISGSIIWNIIQFIFIGCSGRGLPNFNKTKMLNNCFYLIQHFLKSKKKKSGTILSASYSACLIFECLYFFKYWGICIL